MADTPSYIDGANDALNRMKRAQERGTGCHLTSDMIQALHVTIVGSLWADTDPRTKKGPDHEV